MTGGKHFEQSGHVTQESQSGTWSRSCCVNSLHFAHCRSQCSGLPAAEILQNEHIGIERAFERNSEGIFDNQQYLGDATLTWRRARESMEINNQAAITIALIRLMFWHWLQPFLYGIILYGYWDLLDETQRVLGLIVLGREALYFLMTLVCIVVNPVFLLPDHKASWQRSKTAVMTYIFAPEKFVYLAIIKDDWEARGSGSCWTLIIMLLLWIADVSGIIALMYSITSHNVLAAMIMGYAVTAIEFFLVTTISCHAMCTES